MGQRLRTLGDHAGTFVELGRALGDLADDVREVAQHLLDAGGQLVDGLVAFDDDLPGQIALGCRMDDLQELVDLLAERLGLLPFVFRPAAVAFGLFLLASAFILGQLPLFLGRLLLVPAFLFGLAALEGDVFFLGLLLAGGRFLDAVEGTLGGVDRLVDRGGHLADLVGAVDVALLAEVLAGQCGNALQAPADRSDDESRDEERHEQADQAAADRKDGRQQVGATRSGRHLGLLGRLQLAGVLFELAGRSHHLLLVGLLFSHQLDEIAERLVIVADGSDHRPDLFEVGLLRETSLQRVGDGEQGVDLLLVDFQIARVGANDVVLLLRAGFHQQLDQAIGVVRVGNAGRDRLLTEPDRLVQRLPLLLMDGLACVTRAPALATIVSASSRCDLNPVT